MWKNIYIKLISINSYHKFGFPPCFNIISVHSLDFSTGSIPTAKCKIPIPLHGKISLISMDSFSRNCLIVLEKKIKLLHYNTNKN